MSTLSKITLYILIILLGVYILAPFGWILVCSFRPERDLFYVPPQWVPRRVTLDNYNYIFTGKIPEGFEMGSGGLTARISQKARYILPGLRNSSIIALSVMIINLVFGTIAAYSFSRIKFKGSLPAYMFILGTRLLPPIAIAVPFYRIVQSLGLLDTHVALILAHSTFTLPFTVWFLTLYLKNVPPSLEEAALVDGCTRLKALLHIVIPVAIPALAAAAVFALMFSFNEFLFALFLTPTIKSQTLPVIVADVSVNPDVSYALMSACIVLSIIPLLLFAVIFRNYITRGLITTLRMK